MPMGGIGGSIRVGWWPWQPKPKKPRRSSNKRSNSHDFASGGGGGYRFPLKQALTAASLALTGDTIAQFSARWRKHEQLALLSSRDSNDNHIHRDDDDNNNDNNKDVVPAILSDHDWLRALRMASYGFLFYGPGSHAWYQFLDRRMPKQTVQNLMLKVLLNQVVLGPCVITVVFAWNNLWQGKLSQLPEKYRKDAFSTLLYGFRFWIPVSILNFWIVPLQARVAFMSMGSIFWNFCLSSTISK